MRPISPSSKLIREKIPSLRLSLDKGDKLFGPTEKKGILELSDSKDGGEHNENDESDENNETDSNETDDDDDDESNEGHVSNENSENNENFENVKNYFDRVESEDSDREDAVGDEKSEYIDAVTGSEDSIDIVALLRSSREARSREHTNKTINDVIDNYTDIDTPSTLTPLTYTPLTSTPVTSNPLTPTDKNHTSSMKMDVDTHLEETSAVNINLRDAVEALRGIYILCVLKQYMYTNMYSHGYACIQKSVLRCCVRDYRRHMHFYVCIISVYGDIYLYSY
jgi:hypothetical protein